MGLNPIINALPVPSGTEFPGTVQGLLDLLEEYLEVLGLSDFNGINYGSTTPDPDNRDLPWFRFDGGGAFLGIFTWDGADWTIYQPRVQVGTTVERDAITDIYNEAAGGGKQFFNTDDHILYIGTGTGWDPCRPAPAEDSVGDSFYFFTSQQSIGTASGTTNWTEVDLTSYITSAGLTGDTIKAAIVRVNCSFFTTFGGGGTFNTSARIWGDNTVSNDATDVVMAYAQSTRDDSACGAADSNTGFVPIPDQEDLSLYYNCNFTGVSPSGITAQYWLVGFVYQNLT